MPAIITKVHGSRSVYVRVCPRGPVWHRHIQQLRPRYGVKELMVLRRTCSGFLIKCVYGTYGISSNRGPGLYFFHEIFDLAAKRGRLQYETSL